jgi:hypothetical protein
MEEEIINYILKSINKLWLDDFELINKFPKYGNLPSIVWTNLLYFNTYLNNKFPNNSFTNDTFHYLTIALDSFMLSNPSPNQISNFIKNFLTETIHHFKLVNKTMHE